MLRTLIALHLGAMLGGALGTLLIAHFITQRRAPTGNLAWILTIVLIPYVGVPLYLIFGGRKMRRIAARKQTLALHAGDGGTKLLPHETLLAENRLPPPCSGNRLVLHTSGSAHYQALIGLIDSAQHRISICMYILRPDETGRDILERLTRRAQDGIQVRVLLDGVGSLTTGRRALAPLAGAGGAYAYFMPVFRHPLRGRANLRNHRKAVIIDERVVLAGGANIGAEYMRPVPLDPALQAHADDGVWDDLTFTLEGPAVAQYTDVFRSDWNFASGERMRGLHENHARAAERTHASGAARLQVVPSGPDVTGDPLSDTLLTLAQGARERLWIVTPYFVPDDAFCKTVALTAHRGVDVRVLAPAPTNHWLVEIASRSYLREVARAGGTVLGMPHMLHAKAVLVDDTVAILGSANVDMRSLLLNYELALFATSPHELRVVAAWMEDLMRRAHPRKLPGGGFEELGEGLARLLAPQL